MTKKVIPKWLWDFGLVYEAELQSIMSRGEGKRSGYKEVTVKIMDTGEYLEFEFCNIVCL